MEPEIVVVGGGVVGTAIAAALAQRGRAVMLLEQGDPGSAVSGASLACLGTHMHDEEELPLLQWSCEAWATLARSELAFEYRRCGQVRFIDRPQDVDAAKKWVAIERAHGLRPQLLSPEEVRSIEPLLEGEILAATWSPDDAVVNPFLAMRALRAVARENGARIVSQTAVVGIDVRCERVVGVRTQSGQVAASTVVLAAGPWSTALAATAGVTLPITARKAQCLATVAVPPAVRTVVGSCKPDGGIDAGYTQIQQSKSGQILFNTVFDGDGDGKGASDDGDPDRIPEVDPRFVRGSVSTLLRLFPSLHATRLLRSWVRYEAVTPDDRFCIGPAGPTGLLIAAGDGGTGFVRAPAIGRIIADMLDERTSPFRTDMYDVARFEAKPKQRTAL